MRLKSLQKRLEKIYESDGTDFGGEYLWCKSCPKRGVVANLGVGYCTASKGERATEFHCAMAYKKWECAMKEAEI